MGGWSEQVTIQGGGTAVWYISRRVQCHVYSLKQGSKKGSVPFKTAYVGRALMHTEEM